MTNLVRLSTLLIGTTALAGIATSAAAQSAVEGPFTGPRVEAIVGYDIQ